ncbi:MULTISPECIES: hypothetical protein [Stenotrophomonas]|uniref:hypothetical protein n=1 Tax=Stenotrophomonas TaxID=40323 RepID=UPI000CF6C1EF|nr:MULTISPECIES: hypothetical protein [Stenotrophomonas]AVJ31416.1 hypothetical protein CLM74_00780 [Stenotrophomonas sp. MYb57]
MTQLLKGLVGAGYGDKRQAADDRRKVRVKLTAAGRARHRQREANIQQWMQQALAHSTTRCRPPRGLYINAPIFIIDRMVKYGIR